MWGCCYHICHRCSRLQSPSSYIIIHAHTPYFHHAPTPWLRILLNMRHKNKVVMYDGSQPEPPICQSVTYTTYAIPFTGSCFSQSDPSIVTYIATCTPIYKYYIGNSNEHTLRKYKNNILHIYPYKHLPRNAFNELSRSYLCFLSSYKPGVISTLQWIYTRIQMFV